MGSLRWTDSRLGAHQGENNLHTSVFLWEREQRGERGATMRRKVKEIDSGREDRGIERS